MRLQNNLTGDVLEMPPPNALGQAVIKINGIVVERVLFSDENGGRATLGDGRTFDAGQEFSRYVVGLLEKHAPKGLNGAPSKS